MDSELIDAKVAASEARTDTKFAELIGKIDRLNDKVDHIALDSGKTRNNVWAAAAFVVASMIALLSLLATALPTSFGLGAQNQKVIQTEIHQQLAPIVEALKRQPAK